MRNGLLNSLNTYPWRHLVICLAPLIIVIAYLGLTVGTNEELAVHFKTVRQQTPDFTAAMQMVSNTANFCLYAVYATVLWHGWRKRDCRTIRRVVIFVLVQVCIAALLVQCIKIMVGSPRPVHALSDPSYMPFSLKGSHHSFPSGHTTEIVNASVTLATWFRQPLFSFSMGLLIALVGYSRIHLSQHRLSDVIAGVVLGSLASLLIHFLSSREYRYEYLIRQATR